MNRMVFDGSGGMGVWLLSMRGPCMHNMLGFSWAMHVHVLRRHMHFINYYGIVMCWGWLC